MISFQCDACQKTFTVPDSYAGKRARCKGCGTEVCVPEAPKHEAAIISRPSLRVRRLIADAETMRQAFRRSPIVKIESTQGDPPEVYRISFKVNGLERNLKGKPIPRIEHIAEVTLGADYPRVSPVCKMITPIFHPNIDTAYICIGDHWTAGERLVDLVTRIAEMIGFQAYNIRSPLDGEAAMWADLNQSKLPLDPRAMG